MSFSSPVPLLLILLECLASVSSDYVVSTPPLHTLVPEEFSMLLRPPLGIMPSPGALVSPSLSSSVFPPPDVHSHPPLSEAFAFAFADRRALLL